MTVDLEDIRLSIYIALGRPFSTIDLGFSVKGARTLSWRGCI